MLDEESKFKNVAFWSIGLADPFPDETTLIEERQYEDIKVEKYIYPESRYKEGQSPRTIFLPTRHIFFKMIRACMGCESPEDLWFNKENNL